MRSSFRIEFKILYKIAEDRKAIRVDPVELLRSLRAQLSPANLTFCIAYFDTSSAINVNNDKGKVSQGWIDVRKALKIFAFFGVIWLKFVCKMTKLKELPQSSRSKH